MTKKLGRPPLPDRVRREVTLRVMVTRDEHAAIRRAATRSRVTVSAWMRERLRDAVLASTLTISADGAAEQAAMAAGAAETEA